MTPTKQFVDSMRAIVPWLTSPTTGSTLFERHLVRLCNAFAALYCLDADGWHHTCGKHCMEYRTALLRECGLEDKK